MVCMSVCVFLCLSVLAPISRTTNPTLPISVHYVRGFGAVLLWLCCDALCTSSFMDNIVCAHSHPEQVTEKDVYIQSESTSGSTDFTLQHLLKLTH